MRKPQRAKVMLGVSNGADAGGRSSFELCMDFVFVSVLGASAFQMGLLNAVGSLSFLVASLYLGHLVDKRGPLKALRASLILKLLIVGTTAILVVQGVLEIWIGIVLMAIFGLLVTTTETAQVALVPSLLLSRGSGKWPESTLVS